MKSSTMQPSFSLRLVSTIKLPPIAGVPGPLHTLLKDERQNIYYSDEINHSLVSLNASGEIRWHRSQQGKMPGEFHYPKGIELGWINVNGRETECIAVCDSWNRRVQFFDRDGACLTAWDRTGDVGFKDVVDIRFLHSSCDSIPGHSFWLILDRGHNSIFGLDPSGLPIFRIGRPFPENLESRWPTPCDSLSLQVSPMDRFRECLPYDPLFMPLRIFGSAQEALFVLEPKLKRLKQATFGNLLPVWIDLPPGAEWIGAGEDGWIAFNKDAGFLSIYDLESNFWRSTKVEGVPISTGRSTGEIWLQNECSVRHLLVDSMTGRNGMPDLHEIPRALLRLCAEMQCKFRETDPKIIDDNNQIAVRLRAIGKRIKGLIGSGILDINKVKAIRDDLALIPEQALVEMRKPSYFMFQAVLKILQTQLIPRSTSSQKCLDQMMIPLRMLIKAVNHSFVDILFFRDEWILSMPPGTPSPDNKTGIDEQIQFLMDEVAAVAMKTMDTFAAWSWFAPAVEAATKQPAFLKESRFSADPNASIGPIFEYLYPAGDKSSGFLRELDRILLLAGADFASPVQPAALAHFQNQHLLVTLQSAHQVMHLNAEGKILGLLNINYSLYRPLGIAVDAFGRVWISEPLKNCVSIIDISNNTVSTLDDLYGSGLNLQYPFGIQKVSNGSMFVADVKNHRIVVLPVEGKVRFFGNGQGMEPGKFLHPTSFCVPDLEDAVWVVDMRNHRLQKLSLDGVPLQQIGSPGFGRAELIMPEFSVIFDDGVMVVNQWASRQALKIFSPDGNELDTVRLDYNPRGMLVHQGRLLVCSGNGDHIHVYERT
jgi:hypothetical protein